jgi:hypothetical protein
MKWWLWAQKNADDTEIYVSPWFDFSDMDVVTFMVQYAFNFQFRGDDSKL